MALNIKNREVERLAHALADATGESLTDAVRNALQERLDHLRRGSGSTTRMLREVRQIQDTIAALPVLDGRQGDEILYDDHGLPQ